MASAMLFWVSVELQRLFESALEGLQRACAATASEGVCTSLQAIQRTWQERQASMLLLQTGCLALVVAGVLLLASSARAALIRRADAALALLAPRAAQHPGDEIERLVGNLRELAGRQAGFEAEGRWLQQASADLLRARTQALDNLCRIARLLGETEISELHLVSALRILEQTLEANTVGLRLTQDARAALGSSGILSTRRVPEVLREASAEPVLAEVTARLLPARENATATRSLVVPVCKGDLPMGTLAAELNVPPALDDARVQFVESVAHLLAIAMSSVIRSHEERRVALLEERSAIAGELHDSLAQSLAFMKIQVARLQHSLDGADAPAGAVEAARELRDGLTGAYREVRELITAFRVQVGHGGIGSALQDIATEFSERNQLAVSLDNRLAGCHLGINQEFHLLQIVREAVTNTVRHAHASHVWIELAYGPDQRVRLRIEDDGRGMSVPDSEEAHYGLSIMRERALSLGGELTLRPREGGGTCVSMSFAPDRVAPDSTARNGA